MLDIAMFIGAILLGFILGFRLALELILIDLRYEDDMFEDVAHYDN